MSSREVPCFRVEDDQGVGGLFRRQLELLRQRHPDPLGPQQAHHGGPVLQVRAGRVAEGVTAAPVADLQDAVQVGRVVPGQAGLLADPAVPVLCEGLGQLDRQPVQLQVLAVGVLGEELGRGLRLLSC